MNVGFLIIWALEIAVVWAALFAVQIPLRKSRLGWLRIVVFWLKVLLIPGMALLFVAIEFPFSYLHGRLFVATYVALIGDVAASVAVFAVRRIRQAKRPREEGARDAASAAPAPAQRPFGRKLQLVLSLVLCLSVGAYGVLNATHVTQRTHTWEAEGLARPHTFVFVADIHAGWAQSPQVLEEVVRQINAANPEFVILGGDITDEMTTREQLLETYRILGGIEAPTYFIFGNHDRQPAFAWFGGRTYTDAELAAAIEGAGIRMLSDEYVQVAPDLVLLGREDISAGPARAPWTALANPFAEGALVVADHQPYDDAQLAMEASALQLSGHTHAGQLWPLQLVYRILGLQAYGEFTYPGTRLYVTAGESGWMMPFRTEEHCEWDLITLVPASVG